ITMCNLIVSTTHNNQAMNEAVRQVARQYIDGERITEALLNRIEVVIRAFDPCLSCATHALGKMPLIVELLDARGASVDRLVRNASRGHAGWFSASAIRAAATMRWGRCSSSVWKRGPRPRATFPSRSRP